MRHNLLFGILFVFLFSGCDLSTSPSSGRPEQSYEHVRPSWSPDGKTIAFTARIGGTLGIYLVDSSGNNLRLLKAIDGVGITWSPDSRWLAFSSIGKLYKIKVDGDSLKQLTSGPDDIRPSWSRDGTKIAFIRTDIRLLDLAQGTASVTVALGNYPHWHPNGIELVFLTVSPILYSNEFLYRLESYHLETQNLRVLFLFRSAADWGFTTLSPRGTDVVLSRMYKNEPSQIWRADLVGKSFSQLTDDGADFPAWSPDGSRIVYTRTTKWDGGLWIMNIDGTGKRRLTTP